MTADVLTSPATRLLYSKRTPPQESIAPGRREHWQISHSLPIILLVSAAISALFRTNASLIVVSLIASFVVIRILYLLVFKTGHIRFTWLLATGLLLGYGVGTFNTAIQVMLEGWTVSRVTGHDQAALSVGLALILLVCAAMYYIGSIAESAVRISCVGIKPSDQLFLWVGLLLVAAAYLTGGMGYMGAGTDSRHHASPLGAFAALFLPVLPGITIILARTARTVAKSRLLLMLLALELVPLLPLGRRALIYPTVLFFIGLTMTGFRVKLTQARTILLLMLAAVTLYFGNKLFYAMRFERNQMGHKMSIGLLENVQGAAGIVLSGDQRYTADLNRNLQLRTLVLGYFSDLLDASWTHPLMWGEAALFNIRMAIPSSLDRNKDDILSVGQEENFVNPEFGLKARDEANNILTTGVADFGVVGCVVYPLAMSLSLGALFRLVRKKLPPVISIFVFFNLVNIMFQTELATSAFMVTARNLLLVCAGLIIVDRLRQAVVKPGKRQRTIVYVR